MKNIIKLLKIQKRTAEHSAAQFSERTPGRTYYQAEADTLSGIISILEDKKAKKEVLKAWGVIK